MSMSTDDKIEQALFDAAIELSDPGLCEAFLDKICASDPAMRARLDKLISAHIEADAFFDFILPVPAPLSVASARVPGPTDAILHTNETLTGTDPARIGRYRIVQRLGEGGCGVVYLAEQDEPVQRQVALKIIRLGMDTERVIARFALERQALAMMNHPHIARVFDAGATEAGRPFFAMELVAGERITTYCDTQRLSVRERLELFIHVCMAVQHAHQKGILHRDLKPSNVLVTQQDGAAVPKVIDFGVAKAVSAQTADGGTLAPEQFIGTPAYMSPEQARPGRQDVDTRTDIYSLGALLYELLTGCPPFDSKKLMDSGIDALRRTLCEVDPPSPSTRLRSLSPGDLAALAENHRSAPAAMLATLRRDLDWIVMRALEKEQSRRYVTVQGLVLDLRRYLDDEPVVARPASRLYQWGKLVRRHRGAFVAGTLVLVALVGGLGASTWLYLRERTALQEQTRLRALAEEAERISSAVFLTRENRMDEANTLLASVLHTPTRPSFEGLTAYRAIGDWLAIRQRWTEAADRFAVVERVGRLDAWDSVTIDHQSYGVALLMRDDLATYEHFRLEHAARFSKVTNGDAVSRVLKTCLLRPMDESLQQRLLPLGEIAEQWFSRLPRNTAGSWPTIPIALWRYRKGDFVEAEQAARLGYEPSDHTSARIATQRTLLALCALRLGRAEEAHPLIATASADIAAKFAGPLAGGNGRDGYWWDWAFAQILLKETEAALPAPPTLPPSTDPLATQ